MIDGRSIGGYMASVVGTVFISGFALGVSAALLLPAVWGWLKPLLHLWTE